MTDSTRNALEEQIDAWRAHVSRHAALGGTDGADVAELESHLRDAIDDLQERGLSVDEAFLVAVRRLGAMDELSREFAREHSDRLWKQLMLAGDAERGHATGAVLAVALAAFGAIIARGLIIAGPMLEHRLFADLGLAVIAVLATFFLVRRRATPRTAIAVAVPLVAGALAANLYPFEPAGMTVWLQVLHLAVVAWFAVGIAYVDGAWRTPAARMDFLRFTGEWTIYLVLICLGGGVLTAITVAILGALDVPGIEYIAFEWIAPMGFAAATVVAAWLVEAKQTVIENLAPVLTRVFTPLFTVLLIVLVPATLWFWDATLADRNLLIAVNALLIVVVALVLYAVSARTPAAPADWFDRLQIVMVAAAVTLDAILLTAIALRIGEYGITANKLATLGLNVLLLVNLVVSLIVQVRFVRGRSRFAEVGGWQTAYLPAWCGWAVFVAFVMPPLFAFA